MQLDPLAFNSHLAGMGQDVTWRRSHACPCVTPNSGQAKATCQHCAGRGRIWEASVDARTGVAGGEVVKKWIQSGVADLLDGVDSAVTAMVLPTVHQAVKAIASETAYRWKDAVSKAQLWNGEKQTYIESIRWIMTGDFTALVSTDYRHAQAIETGRPAYDMKRILDTSLKVRTVAGKGKNGGKRYLIIPFRHNTPGNRAHAMSMPDEVYKKAKMLDVSKVIGTGIRLSGTGALSMKTRKAITVSKRSYQWGGKLPAGMAGKLKPHHAYDPYAGMVRMETSTGGARSSAYLTFRVMMEGSPKWIVPAKPGMFIVQKVVSEMSSAAPAVFAQAIKYLK